MQVGKTRTPQSRYSFSGDGLSVGRLAEHVGMSKSGVFAHLRSKEELQIATVDTAFRILDREVTQRGLAAPEGVARVYAFCDAFLSYLERRVFPGGCFFINAAAELEAREGRVTDHVREVYQGVLDGFTEEIRRAQALGELDAAEDPAQLSFELDSFMVGANLALVFFGDSAAPDRARAAIRDRLERLAPPPGRS